MDLLTLLTIYSFTGEVFLAVRSEPLCLDTLHRPSAHLLDAWGEQLRRKEGDCPTPIAVLGKSFGYFPQRQIVPYPILERGSL